MKKRNTALGIALVMVLTVLAAVLSGGCGDGGSTATPTVGSLPASKTSPSGSSSTGSTPSGGADTGGSTDLSRYMPSTVVSDTPGSLQLTSPDSVEKVTAYYDGELARGGWTIVSSSKTGASTNITATKGATGTTLSISTTGSGCYISLVTYPI